MSAPLPAALPPLAIAPVAAPTPAPRSAPIAPGLAMRIARSPFVPHSAAAVETGVVATGVATRVTRTGGAVRTTAGAGAMRAIGTGGVVVSSAVADAAGRSIHAVVSPAPRAVVPMRASPIVASFHGLCCMARFLLSPVRRGAPRAYSRWYVLQAGGGPGGPPARGRAVCRRRYNATAPGRRRR